MPKEAIHISQVEYESIYATLKGPLYHWSIGRRDTTPDALAKLTDRQTAGLFHRALEQYARVILFDQGKNWETRAAQWRHLLLLMRSASPGTLSPDEHRTLI